MSFNAISAALCSASHQSREVDAPVFCHPLTGYSSYQYPVWAQRISFSKLTNPIDYDPSARFRRPPSACWHKDVQPRLFDPIHSAGNEFEPEVVFVSPHSHHLLQPLLPFFAGKSGAWASCLLTPTNHDATLAKPPDMTNKCPAPTKELLLDTGNWSCCKCRPQNSGRFCSPFQKHLCTVYFLRVYQHSNIQKSDILGVYLDDWGRHGLAFLHKSANDSPDEKHWKATGHNRNEMGLNPGTSNQVSPKMTRRIVKPLTSEAVVHS